MLTKTPDNWRYQDNEIAAQITAYRVLMDHITEDLLAAYGMASDPHAARLAILSSNVTPTFNT